MLNEVMNGITVALPFVVGVGGVGVLASGYVKASPDTALIISGLRKKPKVLIGKARIKVPFFERMDKLSLKLIPLDIKTGDAVPTADCINIYVDSAVNVKVGSTSEMVEIAAQNFLNKSTEEIGDIVTEVLEGNIREIICTMKLRELIGDRKTFVEKVSENVIPDLKKMGLELVSFNVQRFSDENHVINDLGIDNISQIKKDAAIAKANADKEVEIAKAKASKEANDARVQSESEIAIKQNELDIKKAELKKESDIKKAEADAAYTIQEEEQRKTVEITTANANLAKQEKELELKEREVAIQEKTLEASIKKKAESVKAAGKAEAEAIAAKGQAEAEATRAKAEAEAAGIQKKAEAMKEYGEAARQQMELDTIKVYFEQLPKIAEAVGKGYTNVDSIKMFGGDSSQLAGNIMTTMSQVTDGIKESTGIDITALLGGFLGGKLSTPSVPSVNVGISTDKSTDTNVDTDIDEDKMF